MRENWGLKVNRTLGGRGDGVPGERLRYLGPFVRAFLCLNQCYESINFELTWTASYFTTWITYGSLTSYRNSFI